MTRVGLPPSGIVTVRLAPRDADDIDELVEDGRFTSRSDFIRYAVKLALDTHRVEAAEGGISALTGPGSLPEAGDAAVRRGPRPAKQGVKLR